MGAVSGILKETGSGPHDEQRSAHPQMVVFDRAGRVVSADLGSDRLSVLELDDRAAKYYGKVCGTGQETGHVRLRFILMDGCCLWRTNWMLLLPATGTTRMKERSLGEGHRSRPRPMAVLVEW